MDILRELTERSEYPGDAVADLTCVISFLDGYGLVVTDDSLVEERIRDLIGAEQE